MKRLVTVAISALLLGLAAGACDDEPRRFEMSGPMVGGNPHCGQYATCGTCTPALGCGWCATSATTGICVDDPGNCPEATTIGWTWEPVGCHGGTSDASILAEASVGSDAGAGEASHDSGGTQSYDAAPDVY
jgi:hypothetical protein